MSRRDGSRIRIGWRTGLVGNRADAATLEVTLMGPQIEFRDGVDVAVAGAEFRLTLDERARCR